MIILTEEVNTIGISSQNSNPLIHERVSFAWLNNCLPIQSPTVELSLLDYFVNLPRFLLLWGITNSYVYALRIYVCLFETVRQKYDFISFPYNTQTGIYLQKNQSQMMDYT